MQWIEAAAAGTPSALDRHTLRTELRKAYGGLRNDDSIWSSPAQWVVRNGIWQGHCSKTKSTEATANRLKGGMPFALPIRGLSAEPQPWTDGMWTDIRLLKMNPEHGYSVPCPGAVKSGVQDPGAASAEESLAQLRRSLWAAGLPQSFVKDVKAHTAKRFLGRLVNSSGIFSPKEVRILLHHRETGQGVTAMAYDPEELNVPVAKLRLLFEHIRKGHCRPDEPAGAQWIPGYGPGLQAAEEGGHALPATYETWAQVEEVLPEPEPAPEQPTEHNIQTLAAEVSSQSEITKVIKGLLWGKLAATPKALTKAGGPKQRKDHRPRYHLCTSPLYLDKLHQRCKHPARPVGSALVDEVKVETLCTTHLKETVFGAAAPPDTPLCEICDGRSITLLGDRYSVLVGGV